MRNRRAISATTSTAPTARAATDMLSEAATTSAATSSTFSMATIAATAIQKLNSRGTTPVAHRDQAPGRLARRQQAARQRVGDEHQFQAVENGVLQSLQARIRQIERIERIGDREQPEQRDAGEHQRGPDRGEGAPQLARRSHRRIARDDAPRHPADRRGDQAEGDRQAEEAQRLPAREPARDAAQPIVEQAAERRDIVRRLADHARPEQRAENARSAFEGLAREQRAPRRADARIIVVDLQGERARAAQIGVKIVVRPSARRRAGR